MQLGMIGLGRMGANMVRRLLRDGHECVVFDANPAACNRSVPYAGAMEGGRAGIAKPLRAAAITVAR